MAEEAEEFDCKRNRSSYLKLSHLHSALREHLDERYIAEILDGREGDVNYEISNRRVGGGRTALFLALDRRNLKAFNLLLNRGADSTVKNAHGSTVLHQILEEKHKKHSNPRSGSSSRVDDPFIDSALSLLLPDNPVDPRGLSHLHAACMTNNAKAVELFLRNGSPADQAVSPTSPIFAGYTGLHFSARFCAPKALETLLDAGADARLKDARGMTALHSLLERNIRIMRNSSLERRGGGNSTDLAANERMMNLLLENGDDGPTRFHAACAMRDGLLARRFLKHVTDVDRAIPASSPFAPGCTALHLAALFSAETVKLLLRRGANLGLEDVEGTTPLDVCMERYNVDELHSILTECQWGNATMSDGKTRLLDLLLATRSSKDFAEFLRDFEDVNAVVPGDSPLWPGYTALHLAVGLYSRTKSLCGKRTHFHAMRDCLSRGASVLTALHFAAKLGESDAVNLMFQYHRLDVNPTDEEGWSHLHVACAVGNEAAVEKLILNGADARAKVKSSSRFVSVVAGSTALHVAVAAGCSTIVSLLMRQQAAVDVYATDDDGFTPIHRSLAARPCIGLALLAVPNLRECVVEGLGHLHVACALNCPSAVRKLLHAGANVNEIIRNSWLPEYVGLSPLHVAVRRGHWELARLLVQHGAEATTAVLFDALKDRYTPHQDPFVAMIDNGDSLLQVACKKVDVELAGRALESGADANATTRGGYAALHLLMAEASEFMHDHRRQIDVDAVLRLLLDRGADVAMRNEASQTPLIMADKLFYVYMDQPSESPCGARVDSMLRSIRNFSANPVDADGVSHFHIACSWNNARVAEAFLRAGVDVNQSTDHFADRFAGCTALHLTLSSQTKSLTGVPSQLETVELLLRYGADVKAEDARGNTPLHTAAKHAPPRERLFDLIVRAGADVNATNIYGETPLEILLKARDATAEEVGFFLSRGCRANDFNPVSRKGYVAVCFSSRHHDAVQKSLLEAMLGDPCIDEIDVTGGRTAIHNVVSTGSPIITDDEYADLVERLIDLGCDIDFQDKLGKTALHVATEFQNDRAISGLLSAGADVNLTDANGKPAFAYSLEPCKVSYDEYREGRDEIIKRLFAVHVHKLQLGKLDVSAENGRVQARVTRRKAFDAAVSERFAKELEATRDVKIGSWLLRDFVCETGAVAAYPRMTLLEREAVDEFFESTRGTMASRFGELAQLLRLQYRKARARFGLIDEAGDSMLRLTGIPLPEPCAEAIFRLLKNSELRSLIEATRIDVRRR